MILIPDSGGNVSKSNRGSDKINSGGGSGSCSSSRREEGSGLPAVEAGSEQQHVVDSGNACSLLHPP